MSKRTPTTPATAFLDQRKATYVKHTYDYLKKGSDVAAEGLGVDIHVVVKTLIMVNDEGKPLIMLQHGDKEVGLKDFARQTGTKNIQSASIEDAQKWTGYTVGGISPFGTKKRLPVYIEETILDLPRLFINGGMRGFVLEMEPAELVKALSPKPVKTAR